jgi:hypothetical protein
MKRSRAVTGSGLRRGAIEVVMVVACLLAGHLGWLALGGRPTARLTPESVARQVSRIGLAEIQAACQTDNPYLAVSILSRTEDGLAIVGLTQDTTLFDPASPFFNSDAPSLFSHELAGNVFGLAYDHVRHQVYSSGFHMNGQVPGKDSIGRVFRVDLATNESKEVLSVPAGSDPLPFRSLPEYSPTFVHGIGRLGLGDIDLNGQATKLYVMNLYKKQVHRYHVPSLVEEAPLPILEAAHGLTSEDELLPFGIGVWEDDLYVGAVVLSYDSKVKKAPRLLMFALDHATDTLLQVSELDLDFGRQYVWENWRDTRGSFELRGEPVVSDIEFDSHGKPIISIANRMTWAGFGSEAGGNVFRTQRSTQTARTLQIIPDTSYYEDEYLRPVSPLENILVGGLARMPGADRLIAGTATESGCGGLRWLSNQSGRIDGPINGQEGIICDHRGVGDVEVLCPPTLPTPLLIETPSPTATPIPSATATPSATVTPSPTPRPIYLPLAAALLCFPVRQKVAVSLVLDLSTSMGRAAVGGGRKVDGLVAAVATFVGLMLADSPAGSGPNDRPQVGLIGFHRAAFVIADLTAEPGKLQAAISSLPEQLAEGTRLDLGLLAGAQQLQRQGSVGAQRVLVLFTDGLPNLVPTPAPAGSQEDTVIQAATAVRAGGVTIHSIGLGWPDAQDPLDRINAPLLAAIAGSSERYHQTPDARELDRIFAALAAELLGCP